MTEQYHHGDLPNALRAAAADVIVDKGLGGFSLREVARRAGVSHAAPAHHFGGTTGLLTSLAVEAFNHLYADMSMAATTIDDPVERLVAIGRGYVSIGVDHPAHCQILFRHDLVDAGDQDYAEASNRAYGVLLQTVGEVAADINPELDVDNAAKLCWSAMQGLVVLHEAMAGLDEKAGRDPQDPDQLVVQFTHILVEGFRQR